MSTKFSVYVEPIAEKKYIKDLIKKYKGKKWDITCDAIEAMCANPLELPEPDKLEIISDNSGIRTCKLYFKIAGTTISAKRSGYRCIVEVNTRIQKTRILLVYGKNHVKGTNETLWWQEELKKHY
jgi:hypothetical protein